MKLRDEMKQRQSLEKEFEQLQNEFQQMKDGLYQWHKSIDEKYRPEIE